MGSKRSRRTDRCGHHRGQHQNPGAQYDLGGWQSILSPVARHPAAKDRDPRNPAPLCQCPHRLESDRAAILPELHTQALSTCRSTRVTVTFSSVYSRRNPGSLRDCSGHALLCSFHAPGRSVSKSGAKLDLKRKGKVVRFRRNPVR